MKSTIKDDLTPEIMEH